jgi:ureidoacrylate peracid hydrolase
MGWDVSRVQSAVKRLDRFIERAREERLTIVWTQSFVDSDRTRPSFMARSFMQEAKSRSITFVEEGQKGSDWYSGMTQPLPDEYVIKKYHYDAFEDTNLHLLLGARGIKTLLMTGFIANVCVETAARHAYIKGYYVVVVSDCTDAATEQEQEATLFNIKNYFGKVATSEEISKIWYARSR